MLDHKAVYFFQISKILPLLGKKSQSNPCHQNIVANKKMINGATEFGGRTKMLPIEMATFF